MTAGVPVALKCAAMNYDWGKVGESSLVYRMISSSGIEADKSKPYAELWMGDHDSAPSLTNDGQRISQLPGVAKVPYLFKVLSVEKPLSIQAHPDKSFAEVLHARDPKNYPDPNHKPEMGLFITRTTLLYGFRDYKVIINFLHSIPEFGDLIHDDTKDKFVATPSIDTFKAFMGKVFHADKAHVEKLSKLFEDNLAKYHDLLNADEVATIKAIRKYFPSDVGVFFPLILKVVVAEPWTALFIPAGTLHAYVSGDLYEAMALSDNVVRAGMTPKFIDVDTLMEMLNFAPTDPHWVPCQTIGKVDTYQGCSDEFYLAKVSLKQGEEYTVEPFAKETLMSIGEGECVVNGSETCKFGSCSLCFKGNSITLKASKDSVVVFCSYK